MFGIGHHDLTVGAPDVGRQRIASPCRVDAAQHIAADARGSHLVQEFRAVAHQDADVQWAVVVGDGEQRGGAGRRVAQMFTPGPRGVAVLHRNGVRRRAFAK